MTREEAIKWLDRLYIGADITDEYGDMENVQPYEEALNMAIKALSQEPCKDAISRELALREIDKYMCGVPFEKTLDVVIQELPPVTPKARWIPCNEQLPEDGTYLVTVERMNGEPRVDIKPFAKELNKVNYFDFPKHKCGWYDYDSEYGYWEDTKVIAWMPLPQPYKAESEDK